MKANAAPIVPVRRQGKDASHSLPALCRGGYWKLWHWANQVAAQFSTKGGGTVLTRTPRV
jgi:hypothetical protein